MFCDADSSVYEPSVVSIGPYHHKSDYTLEMEKTKWESFGYVLELNPEKRMRDYLEAMAGIEQQIRSCYADAVMMDSDDLVKAMLLDACFMLCIFCGTDGALQPTRRFDAPNLDDIGNRESEHYYSKVDVCQQISRNITDHNDSTIDNTYLSRQWYSSFLAHDLLLMENQIPFPVVVKIYEFVTNGSSPIKVLLENVARFTENLLLSYPKAVLRIDHLKEVHHLLHLCHQYFKPKQTEVRVRTHPESGTNFSASSIDEAQSEIAGRHLLGWHQASEYYKAGVQLKKREFCIENPHSLLDIRFCDGIMEMPCLTIDTNTHCLFRNLIAFEETCPQFGNHITAYVVFLSQFISMSEDVSLLIKTGIIVHQLDSDAEVSDLFKMVAKAVSSFDCNNGNYLKHVCHEMEVHYQMQRSTWGEWLASISSKLPGWPHESRSNQLYIKSSPEDCV